MDDCFWHQKQQIKKQVDEAIELKSEKQLKEKMTTQPKLLKESRVGLNQILITSGDFLTNRIQNISMQWSKSLWLFNLSNWSILTEVDTWHLLSKVD